METGPKDTRTIEEIVADEHRLSRELDKHVGKAVVVNPNTSQIVASEDTLAQAREAAPEGVVIGYIRSNNGAASLF